MEVLKLHIPDNARSALVKSIGKIHPIMKNFHTFKTNIGLKFLCLDIDPLAHQTTGMD